MSVVGKMLESLIKEEIAGHLEKKWFDQADAAWIHEGKVVFDEFTGFL